MTCLTHYLYKSIYKVCSYGNSREDRDWIYYCTATIGTLALEFSPMCRISYDALFARSIVHYYGLNPSELTTEQLRYAPLLLIHGKWHNQGVWFSLAQTFQEKGINNPLFTVNLEDSADDPTPADYKVLETKFDEIKSLYKSADLKIHLCGYSRGGYVAYFFAQSPYSIPRADVNKIILLGAPLPKINPLIARNVHQINAKYDLLVPTSALCKEEIEIPTGHLNLPYSKDCHLVVRDLIES